MAAPTRAEVMDWLLTDHAAAKRLPIALGDPPAAAILRDEGGRWVLAKLEGGKPGRVVAHTASRVALALTLVRIDWTTFEAIL